MDTGHPWIHLAFLQFRHLVDFDQAMKRSQMYKSEEGRAMLKLQEGDTHHGGCGHCGGDE